MEQSGCSAETTEPYALRVIGDSMSPEFEDAHIIIVDPGHPLVNGAYAVIEQNGEYFFAQYKRKDIHQWLHHLNPDFDDIELANGFVVKGIVIQRSSRRRKDTKHYEYPMMP